MKKLALIIFGSSLIFGGVVKNFNVNSKTVATLKANNGVVEVVVNGKKQLLKKMNKNTFNNLLSMGSSALFEIKDFNFDGNKDIAVSSGSVGYGGVNNYKDYYFYSPIRKSYYLAGKNINSLQVVGKKLVSYTKDGPFTYENSYGIKNGKLYKKLSSVDFGILKRITLFNSSGKKLRDYFEPSTLTITAKKAYFYNLPKESAKSRVYVIKGDKVRVLDYKPFDRWIKIEYKSPKKIFRSWIKQDSVE